MIAALAGFAVLVVVLVAAASLRLVAQMAERSEARLVGMVDRLHEQLGAGSQQVLQVLQESLKAPPPSPLEQAREQLDFERAAATMRFDDVDPFDGLLPPDRPTAAMVGDDDEPFGIPGLTLGQR